MLLATTRSLVADLLETLASSSQDLKLNYQPILSTQSRSVVRWEALMRWRHPAHGMVPPEHVVMLAHRARADAALLRWVLGTVGEALSVAHRKTKISVNIPGFMLLHPTTTLREIEHLFSSYGIKPSSLEIELTERHPLPQNRKTLDALYYLQKIGVKIALDDFGCGHSGLAALRDFNFDRIKLDKSFLRSANKNYRNDLIVKKVVGLAQALSMPVTAEGIEDQEQLQFAEANEFDELQGFLLGVPIETLTTPAPV